MLVGAEEVRMGYEFEAPDGAAWGTTSVGWRLARHLAERFGWQPAGTEPPEDWKEGCPWSGLYTGDSGQRVTASDASALAVALCAALGTEEFDSLVAAFGAEFRGQLAAASTATVKLKDGPLRPDEWRRALKELASFCERGPFTIS